MKKFFSKIIKALFRLFLIIVIAVIILFLIVLAFPEKISDEIIETLAPKVHYSVGNIAWRSNGMDIYGLEVIMPGLTCYLHRVSLRIKKYNYFQLLVAVNDGSVNYTKLPYQHKKKRIGKKSEKPSLFNDIPVKIFFSASNIYFNTSYGVKGDAYLYAEGKLSDKTRILEKLNTKIDFSADSIKFADKVNSDKVFGELNLSLKKRINFNIKPKDNIFLYLNAVNGKLKWEAEITRIDKIKIKNSFINAEIISGKVDFTQLKFDVFGGKANALADISRKKVREKNKWLFKYNIDLAVTNIDAAEFCSAFELKNNKIGGKFSGFIKTAVFGKSVKLLDGKLQSDNPGVFYFPEAEKYIAGMRDSMQKQVFDIMVERLKIYPYNFSVISLKYDLQKKITEVEFRFSGIDEYKFNVFYNNSWINAVKLAALFK